MTSIDDFVRAVRRFCNWAHDTTSDVTAKSEMLTAQRHLSSLYAMALDLPAFEPDWMENRLSFEDWSATFARFGKLPVGYYGSVCNPLEVPAGEAALGDLADDLADIWRDLKEGLMLFDSGNRNAAVFQWQELFVVH